MRSHTLPYGESQLEFQLPEGYRVDWLAPHPPEPPADMDAAIQSALDDPIGTKTLADFAGVNSVGIAVNDKTRPRPQPDLLLPLLQHLESLGIPPEAVTLFVASGSHPPMTTGELPRILDPAMIDRYRVLVHDCDDSPLVHCGVTAYGTPIRINQDYYNCDLKIAMGNIEPHHFMGFSGGVKTAVIGLAGRQTIRANHAMLTHPQARAGVYYLNPLRQDVEEMGRKVRIDLALGAILDDEKRTLEVYFGEPEGVMKAAIPAVRQVFGASIDEPYDLVIASPGGAPKDINLYQAHKGLTHAARVTKEGGWVLLLAACPEGAGNAAFEDYITRAQSLEALYQDFQAGTFEIGPHKAFQIARDIRRVNLVLVSDLDPGLVKSWKLTPSTPRLLNPLLEWLGEKLPPDACTALMPAANITMVKLVNSES